MGGAHLEWYCFIWFSSKQQILPLFIRGFQGGCWPWMILSHMVQQQTTNTVTFYQGISWGVLTLNNILSHMVQQQTINTDTFYQGVPWGGAHLEWYCLIWFSSKQILSLFIRGFHGGVLTLNDIVSYGSAANNKYCHFLSGGSMGGAHLEWYCLIWFSNKQQILSLFIRGSMGGCSPWMILSHMV